MIRTKKYLQYLFPLFGTKRTKQILKVNPTVQPEREEAKAVRVTVYEYDDQNLEEYQYAEVSKCKELAESAKTTWINVDGIQKNQVEKMANYFDVHPLVVEDILSIGQRPKMDEIGNCLTCVLNMLYFNEATKTVETEQISIVLLRNTVISFQDDASRDVFNSLRDKLKLPHTKLRSHNADYLCYSMIDLIVDHYFLVLEQVGNQIEIAEEEIIKNASNRSLGKLAQIKKELIILKRNINPVREVINGFIRSESDLLEDRTTKYFKDVYDHVLQAADLCDNQRDVMVGLQDLYLNQANIRMNEAMKVMAIVTCLMAPATVIGGIFGMNFKIIDGYIDTHYGFIIAVVAMITIPLGMLYIFKRRGWF
jgi:magnesium transporter